jgi:hypothetical protein
MSYAHITIDGNTVLDGDLGQWRNKPPTEFAQYLAPGAQLQPGVMALLTAFGAAARAGQDITANLRNRPTGYDLTVDHGQITEAAR